MFGGIYGVCGASLVGSAGKESACNAGDPSSIPGLGRYPGEGIGYPLQYFGASLVAQLVKNLPAMQETWVLATLWTVAHQAPLSMGILQARMLECVAMPSSRGSSQPRD